MKAELKGDAEVKWIELRGENDEEKAVLGGIQKNGARVWIKGSAVGIIDPSKHGLLQVHLNRWQQAKIAYALGLLSRQPMYDEITVALLNEEDGHGTNENYE